LTRIASIVGAAISLSLVLYLSGLTLARSSSEPLVGINDRVVLVRDWIIANTDRSARILLEDQSPFYDIYGHTYPTATLVYYTGRELISGPHWAAHYKNHFASFFGLTLFDRPVSWWDGKSLVEYMNIYNIGWVGVYSTFWNRLFERNPDWFEPAGSGEGFQFYRVNRKHTFFLEGSGISEADYNRIVLHNVRAPTGRVVIAYHWHPRLRVAPPAKVVRVMIGRDPVGFIGIENPQREMVIETKYWRD
jgi:hypothetical protein